MDSVNGMINQQGGTFINSGTYQSHGISENFGLMTNSGMITGTQFSNDGGGQVINTASGNLQYDAGIFNAGTLHNSGQLSVSNIFQANYALDNFSTGTLQNDGTATVSGPVRNSGTLANFGSFVGTDTYTQDGGQTINNGTFTQAGSINIEAGALSGLGTITTPALTLGTGASLSPGTATQLGTFAINGDLQSSGNMNFRFGGLNAGEFDVLKVNGNASFTGGNLVLNFVNGFTAAAGNSWKFLYSSALSGWNSLLVSVNGLAAGLGYEITSANGAQTLTITSTTAPVPEPSSLLLLGAGLAGLIGFRKKLSQHINKG